MKKRVKNNRKEFTLVKKIISKLSRMYQVKEEDIFIDDINTSYYDNCVNVKFSYISPDTLELTEGVKSLDMFSLDLNPDK